MELRLRVLAEDECEARISVGQPCMALEIPGHPILRCYAVLEAETSGYLYPSRHTWEEVEITR